MAVKDEETEELLKLAQEAHDEINDWPEWKKELKVTKYSEGFGKKVIVSNESDCKK